MRLPNIIIGVVRIRRAGVLFNDLPQLGESLLVFGQLEEADADLQARVAHLIGILVLLDRDAPELVEREIVFLLDEELFAHAEAREEAPARDRVAIEHRLVEIDRGGQFTGVETRVAGVEQRLGLLVVDQRTGAAAGYRRSLGERDRRGGQQESGKGGQES